MPSMRLLLLAGTLLLAAGCSAPVTPAYVATTPASAPAANIPTSLLASRSDAIARGVDWTQTEGFRWLASPRPVFVEPMTHEQARKYLPAMGDSPLDSPERPVWLVVYQGQWQLLPYGQTQGAPAPTIYDGCVFVLLAAQDGSILAGGDAVCPGQR